MRKITKLVVFFVLVLVSGIVSGCGNPCDDLYDKICADLGEDCEIFRSEPSVLYSILPRQTILRKSELAQCEMFLSDENYTAYTMIEIRNQIARVKDPKAPQQPLPELKLVDGLFSGLSGNYLFALPILAFLAMFLYMRWYKKKMTEAQK